MSWIAAMLLAVLLAAFGLGSSQQHDRQTVEHSSRSSETLLDDITQPAVQRALGTKVQYFDLRRSDNGNYRPGYELTVLVHLHGSRGPTGIDVLDLPAAFHQGRYRGFRNIPSGKFLPERGHPPVSCNPTMVGSSFCLGRSGRLIIETNSAPKLDRFARRLTSRMMRLLGHYRRLRR